ncbi:MAG: glycosyltransferase family 1 protein [Candidatus Altiarchaeota archaeon]
MRVGLLGAVDPEATGLHTYASGLESGLRRVFPDVEYVGVSYDGLWYSLDGCGFSERRRYTRLPVLNTLSNHLRLPKIIGKTGVGLVHGLCDFIPIGGGGFRKVYTVHDLTGILFPGAHKLAVSLNHRLVKPRELAASDAIIAVSENTRKDLLEHYDVDESIVTVIHEGVDPVFRKTDGSGVRGKYGLDFPFILYTGTLEPRKNIPTLLKAFRILVDSGVEHRLLLVGRRGWKYEGFFRMVSELGLEDRVLFTGYVPREDLPGLYSLASVFAFPSLYEGFGLPVLEAMACGTPVVCSNSSSLPEVVGDAGLMVDPLDEGGLADALRSVLDSDSLSGRLSGRGVERAGGFTWDEAARKTMRVYEGVL